MSKNRNKTTGQPSIDLLLTPAAKELWHSPEYSDLVKEIHKRQWRILASYLCDVVALQNIRERIATAEANGENPYVSEMGGQGEVLSPLAKQEAIVEKRLRDAESRMGLVRKELGDAPEDDETQGMNFGDE